MDGRRVALLCLAADMPATSKMMVLASHGAIHFGVRSITEYPHKKTGSKTQVSYGSTARAFDNPWPKRDREKWNEGMQPVLEAKNQEARKLLYKTTGHQHP
jgi:hypothetical protein